MVDLAMPAAMAASDRLSMIFSPRLVARHGKAAIRAFKLGFGNSGELSEIEYGANLCAIRFAASDEFSIAFPPLRSVPMQRSQHMVKASLRGPGSVLWPKKLQSW
jgi:hypothetical protein